MTRKEQIKSAYKLTGSNASFYVQGGHKRTDWFIRHLYQPKGFFTPPYESEQSLRTRLSGLYKEAEVTAVEGIGCFCCKK